MHTASAASFAASTQAFLPGFAPAQVAPLAALKSSPESWIRTFVDAVAASVLPRDHADPVEWAEQNIVFTNENDPVKGPVDFSLSPFLKDPLRAWDLSGVTGTREVTLVAPEQMGKSMVWEMGGGYMAEQAPSTMLVYFTSDAKSRMVNTTKLRPLIHNIPSLRVFLDLPSSSTASEYRLGPARIIFGGVGARISSVTSAYNVADEIDDWIPPRGTSPLDDLRKRSRAFSRGLLFKVCTPCGTERQSRIWREFLKSSQGFWYLRCQHCGELTMRSCDVHNLKFELDAKPEPGVHAMPVRDSIRLVCPKCGHEHTPDDRRALVQQGAYIHKNPDRENNLGFQFGYLANLFPAGEWYNIAVTQCRAGKSGDEEAQRYFDNSIRGLPFKPRKLDTGCERALHVHRVAMPDASTIRWRFLAADTQEDCFYYVVRGMDLHRNTYLLDCGRLATTDELRAAILGQYCGGPLLASIIDEGGHRQDEVRALANSLPRVFTYKGNTSIRAKWRKSEDYDKLLLGHAEHWRVVLLQKVYAAVRTEDSYWYTTEAMTDDYIRQISAWTRPSSGKTSDELADGDVSCYKKTDGAPDHLFDCEKMLLMLADYCWTTAIKPSLEKKLAGGAS